jgi:putative redox protein
MSDEQPQVTVDLEWKGDLRFEARAGNTSVTLDGNGSAGPSPVQALVEAVAGCMAADIVHILTKARQVPQSVTARAEAWRAAADPRRLTRVRMVFTVSGDVTAEAAERALALSRSTYCSVWHSLRLDVDIAAEVTLR